MLNVNAVVRANIQKMTYEIQKTDYCNDLVLFHSQFNFGPCYDEAFFGKKRLRRIKMHENKD